MKLHSTFAASLLLLFSAASVAALASPVSDPPASPAPVTPPAPAAPAPNPPTYPAPTAAPPLPPRTLDDRSQPPVIADDPAHDPYDENDPDRTPANMLTPQQVQAILDSETSPFWLSAKRNVYGENGGTLKLLADGPARSYREINDTVLGKAPEPVVAGKKLLALTFDDGPHTATTQPILDVLKKYRVPATFFFVGEMAEKHPELVRAAFKDGHSIGNHTYHHVSLRGLNVGDSATEIKACGNILRAITGQTPHLFRPPGGGYNADIVEEASLLGYTTVLWTGDPGDYQKLHPATIAQRTIACAQPGGIIILHSGVWQTVRALPYIIESLRAAGYTLVSVDTMEKARATGVRTASTGTPAAARKTPAAAVTRPAAPAAAALP